MKIIKKNKKQVGFTLIELMTVTLILSILASLSIAVFGVMRLSTAYAASYQALRNAQTSLYGYLSDTEATLPFVDYSQTAPGTLSNGVAVQLLPGFQNSTSMKISVYHDPDCDSSSCESERIEISHCNASQYVSYSRYGDGVEVILENLPGTTC